MKLSRAQITALRRLANGEVLYHIGGINARYFFGTGTQCLNILTVYRLCELKLIESYKSQKIQLDSNYRITANGRAAIKVVTEG